MYLSLNQQKNSLRWLWRETHTAPMLAAGKTGRGFPGPTGVSSVEAMTEHGHLPWASAALPVPRCRTGGSSLHTATTKRDSGLLPRLGSRKSCSETHMKRGTRLSHNELDLQARQSPALPLCHSPGIRAPGTNTSSWGLPSGEHRGPGLPSARRLPCALCHLPRLSGSCSTEARRL